MPIGGAYAYEAFGKPFANALATESWTFYTISMIIVALRSYARIRKLGIRGLDWDDYLMYMAVLFYTLLIVCLNLTAQGAGSALYIPGYDPSTFPPDEIAADELGAKIDLVAEQAMLNTIWLLKGCMLFLYNRLTLSAKNNWAVKALAIYTVVGYVAIQMTFFLQCRPFNMYWQVNPPPSLNCMVLWTYAAVQMPFNISSDILMMAIPLPMLWKLKVPLRQKLVLVPVFSLGLFVIASALATKIEFWISIYSADYMFWYTREASVAMYVANLPCIWPLLREKLSFLSSFANSSAKKYGSTNPVTGKTTMKSRVGVTETMIGHDDSDDALAGRNAMLLSSAHLGDGLGKGIVQSTTVHVSSADADLEQGFEK